MEKIRFPAFWTSAIVLIALIVLPNLSFAQIQGSATGAGYCSCGAWVPSGGEAACKQVCHWKDPSSGGGSAGDSSSANPYSGLSSAAFQLGQSLGSAFGQWLFSSVRNPQAELQKQLMMKELARRAAEAERQHREEEARRIAEMYNRLASVLKLRGFRRIFSRFEKLDVVFFGFLNFALIVEALRFLNSVDTP